jgi:histidinol-phosphate aminotransferase
MIHFDRRAWLRSFSFAAGGLGASRLLGAPQSTATAAAATLRPTDHGGGADSGRGGAPGGAAARGSGVLLARLSLNENPYGPSPAVVAALQREFSNLCRYTGAEYDGLVGSIAAREGVPKEQIILGEILEPLGTYLSLQGGPGGEFIYSDPGYTALIDSAVAVGGRAIGVPLNARLENDLPAIAAKVNQRTRAVFLVNPHNPTGIAADTERLKNFARTVSRQALVIVDEAYLEFADHFTQRTLTDLVRGGENIIVFRTFAKVYGLAGLDIGYGLMPRAIAKALSAQGLNNPHLFNRLAVAAAAASLQDTSYVDRVTRQVAEERETWFNLFRDLKVKFTPSSGSFVFFKTGTSHSEFAAALLKDGVEIGRAFPPYDLWARISIGLPEENAIARAAVRKALRKSAA